jgi:hypothetical protein
MTLFYIYQKTINKNILKSKYLPEPAKELILFILTTLRIYYAYPSEPLSSLPVLSGFVLLDL